MQIEKTKNYSIFKILRSNRTIDQKRVERLSESIKKNNLLHVRPILVSKNMEVIDGQHRLMAAQIADEDVYYAVVDCDPDETMISLNSNSREWVIGDFVDHYAKKYVPEYMLLKQYQARLGGAVSISFLAKILVHGNSSTCFSRLKQGKIRFRTNHELLVKYTEIAIGILKEIRLLNSKFSDSSSKFLLVLVALLSSDIDREELAQKIRQNVYRIQNFSRVDDIVRCLVEVYNFRRSKLKINHEDVMRRLSSVR